MSIGDVRSFRRVVSPFFKRDPPLDSAAITRLERLKGSEETLVSRLRNIATYSGAD
jgi:hypothetical protein